jgi:hypothetical protein
MSSQSGNSTVVEGEGSHSEDENNVRKDMALRQEPRAVEAQGSNGSEDQNDQLDDFVVFQKKKRRKKEVKKIDFAEQPDNKYPHLKILHGQIARSRQSIADLIQKLQKHDQMKAQDSKKEAWKHYCAQKIELWTKMEPIRT